MQNAADAQKTLKQLRRKADKGKACMHEVQQLDKQCLTLFGEGLARFVPTYFKEGGAVSMHPGCFNQGGPLQLVQKWSEAPLLRLVTDRDASVNAAQLFLASRLRAVEVSDPCHILWRTAQLGVEHSGFKGAVATLTIAMNAWKGPLGPPRR